MLRTLVRVASAAALIGGLNVGLVVTPAEANPSHLSPVRRCSFASVTDPTIEDGTTQTGQINGGPISTTTPGATVEMTCTIQVGGANHAHSGADACSVTSMPGLVATVPATLCSYVTHEGLPVYLCTHVLVNGVSWYWDSTGTNATTTPLDGVAFTGEWSTDASATCDQAVSQEIYPGPLCTVLKALAPLTVGDGTTGYIIQIGPDGDLYVAGIWFADCDPEDNGPLPGPWFPDPIICPLFPPGTYGPIIIQPGGDIYIDLDGDGAEPDEFFWNCPPY